ncbi:MAG: hypothetical protein QXD43_04435, partial [Candidatus Aenigmatarchaeota archaeon]
VTWQQIIDLLVEHKSSWSLENMYIISYQKLDNQTQENVEYIGVPKLQALIILDNKIRENLNTNIQYRTIKDQEKKYKQYAWLLEEFIKGKPLYPIILNHVNLGINKEIQIKKNASLYSLIVEANILDFKKSKKAELFSENYFDNYKSLVNQIKNDVKSTSFNASLINQISEDEDTRKRIARELFESLKAKDKNMFLNILLKNLNMEKELCSNSNLNNWIFDKFIKNDESFIMYGLILIINLLRGKNE